MSSGQQDANEARKFRLGVIILAAGASRRMGRPKLLLPWGETTVLGHLLAVWKRLYTVQVAVVCAARDCAMDEELTRLGLPPDNRIINPDPERGMFGSIQCAASWKGWKNLTHWAIVLGDQPHLDPKELRGFILFSGIYSEKICQPTCNGRPRHPVILPKDTFCRLQSTRAGNLKEFLEVEKNNIQFYRWDDEGLNLDLDTPADYERALRL